MPTKVGIHCGAKKKYLDSRFRGNDKLSQHPETGTLYQNTDVLTLFLRII
jgi:hypothetical protein